MKTHGKKKKKKSREEGVKPAKEGMRGRKVARKREEGWRRKETDGVE